MPNVKVATTFKCRWVPNRTRKRVFTERDAARIVCRVVRKGGSKQRIDLLYREICKAAPTKKADEAAIALEMAAQAVQENTDELNNAFRLFQIVNGILTALALLGSVLPGIGRLLRGARAAQAGLNVVMASNIRQRAANDATFRILRQAAANERAFLRASGE